MNPTLEELPGYITKTLPQPKLITKMEVKSEYDAVTFHWQGRRFLVRKSLQVLELRGNNLFITGASTLAQAVLLSKTNHEKILGTVVDLLQEAERLIGSQRRAEAGYRLLEVVKGTLRKLIGSKRHPKTPHGHRPMAVSHGMRT